MAPLMSILPVSACAVFRFGFAMVVGSQRNVIIWARSLARFFPLPPSLSHCTVICLSNYFTCMNALNYPSKVGTIFLVSVLSEQSGRATPFSAD